MKRILKILLVVIAFPFTKCDHKVNENHDLNQEEKGTVFEQQTTPRVVQANPDSVLTLFKGKIRPLLLGYIQ